MGRIDMRRSMPSSCVSATVHLAQAVITSVQHYPELQQAADVVQTHVCSLSMCMSQKGIKLRLQAVSKPPVQACHIHALNCLYNLHARDLARLYHASQLKCVHHRCWTASNNPVWGAGGGARSAGPCAPLRLPPLPRHQDQHRPARRLPPTPAQGPPWCPPACIAVHPNLLLSDTCRATTELVVACFMCQKDHMPR